jgi:hypothetical protein
MPEKVEELREMLKVWRKEVNAQEMVPNPNYNLREAKKSSQVDY